MWCSRAAALQSYNSASQTTTSDLAGARPPSPRGEGEIKSAFVPITKRQRRIIPLRYHSHSDISTGTRIRNIGRNPAQSNGKDPFGARLGGDTVRSVLLPCTKRQLSESRESKRLVLVIALYYSEYLVIPTKRSAWRDPFSFGIRDGSFGFAALRSG